jgi:hypothetical protein
MKRLFRWSVIVIEQRTAATKDSWVCLTTCREKVMRLKWLRVRYHTICWCCLTLLLLDLMRFLNCEFCSHTRHVVSEVCDYDSRWSSERHAFIYAHTCSTSIFPLWLTLPPVWFIQSNDISKAMASKKTLYLNRTLEPIPSPCFPSSLFSIKGGNLCIIFHIPFFWNFNKPFLKLNQINCSFLNSTTRRKTREGKRL